MSPHTECCFETRAIIHLISFRRCLSEETTLNLVLIPEAREKLKILKGVNTQLHNHSETTDLTNWTLLQAARLTSLSSVRDSKQTTVALQGLHYTNTDSPKVQPLMGKK